MKLSSERWSNLLKAKLNNWWYDEGFEPRYLRSEPLLTPKLDSNRLIFQPYPSLTHPSVNLYYLHFHMVFHSLSRTSVLLWDHFCLYLFYSSLSAHFILLPTLCLPPSLSLTKSNWMWSSNKFWKWWLDFISHFELKIHSQYERRRYPFICLFPRKEIAKLWRFLRQ